MRRQYMLLLVTNRWERRQTHTVTPLGMDIPKA